MTCKAKEHAERMIADGVTVEQFKASLVARLERARREVEHCERCLKVIAEKGATNEAS